MAQMTQIGMSITPKANGMEDHVVNQMRPTRGGISRMVEHWVERYHQVGYKYDTQWRLLKMNILRLVSDRIVSTLLATRRYVNV